MFMIILGVLVFIPLCLIALVYAVLLVTAWL